MRLFVALNFPDRVRQGLWNAVAGLRELGLPVRWVPPEGIHLTVKFLGEVAVEQEPALREALTRAAAGGRPLPVAMRGFVPPARIVVHSSNPVGRQRMEQAIATIARLMRDRDPSTP